MAYYHSRYSLPSEWNTRRGLLALQHLKVEGGLTVKYVGPGDSDQQAASVCANVPVPQDVPLYLFEVEVLSKGVQGFIGVGFATEEVDMQRLPGWEPHSYGYHGDDGHVFSGSGRGSPYAPTFTAGDVIGALLNRADKSISFFKNGQPLGVAFSPVPEEKLFPMVGMRTHGEEVRANFGNINVSQLQPHQPPQPLPFKTDFAALKAQFAAQTLSGIRSMALPAAAGGRGSALLPALVFDYLTHHRYWRTAQVVVQDMLPGVQHLQWQQRQRQEDDGMADDISIDGEDGGPPSTEAQGVPARGGDAEEADSSLLDAPVAMDATSSGSGAPAEAAGTPAGTVPAKAARAAAQDTATLRPACAPGTAAAAAEAAPGGLPESVVEEMIGRQRIVDAVCSGDIDAALSLVWGQYGPRALEDHWRLHFHLKVQKFVELVRQGGDAIEAALAYGRSELGPCTLTDSDEELLSEALSLLAYAEPATSPYGHLLRESQRRALAETLNGALLKLQGRRDQPVLERAYRQAFATMRELQSAGHARASGLDVAGMVFGQLEEASAVAAAKAAAAAAASGPSSMAE